MPEEYVSVWQSVASAGPSLSGSEGALVSVTVAVDPRDLENVLDALAHLEFPINPQIYHEAALVYRYAGEQEQSEPVTMVEFPAYAGRLAEVRHMLAARGFGPDCLHVAEMLEELHAEAPVESAPAGARYVSRTWQKRAHALTAGAH
jgi:hypothetical protein